MDDSEFHARIALEQRNQAAADSLSFYNYTRNKPDLRFWQALTCWSCCRIKVQLPRMSVWNDPWNWKKAKE